MDVQLSSPSTFWVGKWHLIISKFLSPVFLQIMATAYLKHEPWEMGVHKRNGVVYLDVHKLPERPKSDLDRRRYWTFMTLEINAI